MMVIRHPNGKSHPCDRLPYVKLQPRKPYGEVQEIKKKEIKKKKKEVA